MNNVYKYKITLDVYNWMLNELKNIEVRLLNEKSANIKPNDIIIFSVFNDEEKNVKVKVLDVIIKDNIEELIQEVGISNIIPLKNIKINEIKNMMYGIFGKDNVDDSQIIGIKFKLM